VWGRIWAAIERALVTWGLEVLPLVVAHPLPVEYGSTGSATGPVAGHSYRRREPDAYR
jgi:hypothetical protein